MFMRNVNFDTGIVNGTKGVVRAVSPRIVDVEVITSDSPSSKYHESFSKLKSGREESHSIPDNFPYAFATQLPSAKAKVRLFLKSVSTFEVTSSAVVSYASH